MLTITSLFIYPIKSLGGFSVSAAMLTDRGFAYDRRWMLLDENNRFITQRELQAMALLQTSLREDGIMVTHKTNQHHFLVPFQPETDEYIETMIWDDTCSVQFVSKAADGWFSNQLGTSCRLVYMPEPSRREVDHDYAKNGELTALSDGYPLLMIGEASLADLNARLETPIGMERFRPNIMFSGGMPYQEDDMKHFRINGLDFYGVKPCARCVMTTIDQETGTASKEPLKTLATYRQQNNKTYFGQNLVYQGQGTINTGDEIIVLPA